MFTLTSEAKSGLIPSLITKNQKHTWDYSKVVLIQPYNRKFYIHLNSFIF